MNVNRGGSADGAGWRDEHGTRRTLRVGLDCRGNLVGEILTAGLGHSVFVLWYLQEGEWQVGRHEGRHTGWMSEEVDGVGCQAGERSSDPFI